MKLIEQIIVISFLSAFVIATMLQAETEQRTALIIGNSAYNVGRLKNPANDATDMADVLRHLGFSVILKKNAQQQEMEEAIRDFGHRLKRGGVGLFFYAGHGLQINGRNYLIPISSRIEKESDVKYKAIDVEIVLDEMANAGNPVNIVILDACRDNPLGRSMRSAGRGLAIISDAPQGTFITYSTSPGKTAADGEGRNSPYTAALLKSIREPGLPIEQVFKQVRQRLIQETKNQQVPWELSSLQGDFYFAPSRNSNFRTTDNEKEDTAMFAESKKAKKTQQGIAKERERYDLSLGVRPSSPLVDNKSITSSTLGAVFVLIQAGTFTMGSPLDEPGRDNDESPQPQVTISKSYYIQTTEVTQGQWLRVMGKNPSHFSSCGDDCPVEQVSWYDAQDFINRLNQIEGTDKYRLPTEAEWEYAARGGSTKAFANGDITNTDCVIDPNLDEMGWYCGNSGGKTHPVAKKSPNARGLYDMHGNVLEWVKDWKGSYFSGRVIDPTGPSSGSYRIDRGGSWDHNAKDCRSAVRSYDEPIIKNNRLGFRLAITP